MHKLCTFNEKKKNEKLLQTVNIDIYMCTMKSADITTTVLQVSILGNVKSIISKICYYKSEINRLHRVPETRPQFMEQ